MVSSTNSPVDPATPSTFRYFQRGGVVWGDYEGDTVDFGHFVGTRVGTVLTVSFAHTMADDGALVAGTGRSVVEAGPDGIRLIERFRIGDVDHVSVCVEVPLASN